MDRMAFFLRTLGSLELRDAHGNVVRGAGVQRKPLLILAITALQPDGISRSRLLQTLWPGVDRERARASLKQHLYALRVATGSATIIGGSPTLRIDRKILKVDLLELYEAVAEGDLRAAAEHFRGELLDGVDVRYWPELAAMISNWREELAPTAELLRSAMIARRSSPGIGSESLAAARADRLLREQVEWSVRSLRTLSQDRVAATHRVGSILEGMAESLHLADRVPLDPARVGEIVGPLVELLRRSGLHSEMEEAGERGTIGPALWGRLVRGTVVTVDPMGRAIDQAMQQSSLAGQYRGVSGWFRSLFVRTLLADCEARISLIGAAPVGELREALSMVADVRPAVDIFDLDHESLAEASEQLDSDRIDLSLHRLDQGGAVAGGWLGGSSLVVVSPATDRHQLSDLVWLADSIFSFDDPPDALALAPAVSGAGWITALRYLAGWGGLGFREEDLLLLCGRQPGMLKVSTRPEPSHHRWLVTVRPAPLVDPLMNGRA